MEYDEIMDLMILIDHFDFNKSYWITKYRPINDVDGLDFNPSPFREAALHKQATGKYSGGAIYGSKAYKEYWNEQKRRCIEGYEFDGIE